ncbi:MAG: UDP-N-acetylmuramate dehydrogenase [Candidatus Hydrogenedentes bacterium]|nr:UDP-N-acetylmuramate dehydrogenase [Candidatus Hydrogenedentota bacterium]
MGNLPFDFAVENYPLAGASLYQVGGPARLALIPRTRGEVEEAYAWLRTQDLPTIVLGGGSNVLISDAGFPGIVIFTNEIKALEALGGDRFLVEGGLALDTLVREVILANNYEGAGALTGIPGTVGGAIYMNAGTVNGSICELMESVEVITEDGVREIPMEPSIYSYRAQTFCPPKGLILSATFRLRKAEEDQQAIYDHYIERRRQTQPQGNSCGSVFKNPEGEHAGRLIESCGLKGTRHGGAVISDLHANFIVNDQGATCADILSLIDLCKRRVLEKFDIELQEEVKVFGAS